jgi:hypothetical protein
MPPPATDPAQPPPAPHSRSRSRSRPHRRPDPLLEVAPRPPGRPLHAVDHTSPSPAPRPPVRRRPGAVIEVVPWSWGRPLRAVDHGGRGGSAPEIWPLVCRRPQAPPPLVHGWPQAPSPLVHGWPQALRLPVRRRPGAVIEVVPWSWGRPLRAVDHGGRGGSAPEIWPLVCRRPQAPPSLVHRRPQAPPSLVRRPGVVIEVAPWPSGQRLRGGRAPALWRPVCGGGAR